MELDAGTLAAVRRDVLAWYGRERRDFPWRRTRDPYAVLVSEVMLQQTQASRVAERYPDFLARFPTAEALAAAPEAEVVAAWSGLGYYRRALALRRAAAAVVDSGWPRDVAPLERLPGIGPYTARAIASLAFGEPVGAVDTNVRRWLVRRFGVPAAATRRLQELADALARPPGAERPPAEEAATWTHASMELGRVCTARAPRCGACPVAVGCPARRRGVEIRVPRQAPFAGSARARRGALLRLLAAAEGHSLERRTARRRMAADGHRLPAGGWRDLLAGLERDGLLHRAGGRLRLGGRPDPRIGA